MPTPAQNRANHKYRAKAYDQIAVSVPKGTRDKYRAQAAAHGLSLNAYIVALLDADAQCSKVQLPSPPVADD